MNTEQIFHYVQGLLKGKDQGSWSLQELQDLKLQLQEAVSKDKAESLEKSVCFWLVGYISGLQLSPDDKLYNSALKNEFIEFVTTEHANRQAQVPVKPAPQRQEPKPFSGGVVFRESLKLKC